LGAASLPLDFDLLELHERHRDRYPILLESVSGAAALGRYDVLLALPGERLVQQPDGTLAGDAAVTGDGGGFLAALDQWFSSVHLSRVEAGDSGRSLGEGSVSIPNEARPGSVLRATGRGGDERIVFSGGWFLYLGYELAGELEPSLHLPRASLPRAIAWRMRGALVRDHLTGTTSVLGETTELTHTLRRQVDADLAELPSSALRVPTSRARGSGATESSAHRLPPTTSSASSRQPPLATDVREDDPAVFLAGVQSILDSIAAGDVYQANLSRGWHARLADGATAVDLYRALRRANPAPFAALASLGDFTLLSSSPERLLELRDGIASTRPIAGTRPRGVDADADAALVRELRLNEKERAEHVMLVDLERNDLGRVCRGGTVHVDEYMTIETYATVHHIVSNVRGVLREDVTPGQAIAAVFPGGTITGCPKIRCMQILAKLEHEPRDAYTGSLGYLARSGALDLNILIRTLTLEGDKIGFRTGAGIVADSVPEAELAETRAKAHGILRALGHTP
jgi:anthranilate synthase component 1